MAVFILVAVLEASSYILTVASRSSKKARRTPPTTAIPEKPSRREAMTSN